MKTTRFYTHVWLTLFMLVGMLVAGGTGIAGAQDSPKWTYATGKLTQGGITLNNVTELSGKLTIGDNKNFAGTTLDLSGGVEGSYEIDIIDEWAFYTNESLTTVKLPSTLTKIKSLAFYNSNVASANFPPSLTSIGDKAFGNTKLTKVDLSTCSNINLVSGAFGACQELTEIVLPENLTRFSTAFTDCANLKSVNLPATVQTIDGAAFVGIGITSIDLSQTKITNIFYNTFLNCSQLEKIILPASVQNLGSDAFKGCDALKTIICLRETEPTIDATAFGESTVAGRTVYAPNGTGTWDKDKWKASGIVKDYPSVPDWLYEATEADNGTITRGDTILSTSTNETGLTIVSFSSASNITSLDLTGIIADEGGETYTITTIGENAFKNNQDLIGITLPGSIATIGGNAFDGCSALTSITCLTTDEPTINTDAFANGPDNGRKVFAFNATTQNWNANNQWGTNTDIINKFHWTYDNGTLSNPEGTIVLNATLTDKQLTITGSTTLSDNADLNLSGYFGDADKNLYTIVAIDANVFAGKKLGTVTIPASVGTIGERAFNGATITTLRMLANTPPTAGNEAFKLANPQNCVVRVPDSKLSAYHTENENDYTNWCNLPYILEEQGETWEVSYSWESSEMTEEDVTFPDFKVVKVPAGQLFQFPLKAADANDGLMVKAFDGETEITEGFSYKNDTVSIKLTKNLEYSLIFKSYLLKPITEEGSKDITITSDEEYKIDQDTKFYNGQIGDGEQPTEVKSLTVDNETTPLNILLNQVLVATEDSKTSTTIKEKTVVTFSLAGTNDLGTVENNGTLTLQAYDNTVSLNTANTKVTNNNIFTDYTGFVQTVTGDAPLTISSTSADEEEVQEGSSIVLTAKGTSSNGTATITYEWQKKDDQGAWETVKGGTETAPGSKTAGDGSAANELEVLADAIGDYRCLVTAAIDSKTTTLTRYTTVKLGEAEPTPPPYIPSYYSVELPEVTGAVTDPAAGTYTREEGDSFSFSLTLDPAYDQSTPVVKVNGSVIEPGTDGKYRISSIYSDTNIEISGVVPNTATGIDNANDGLAKVWASGSTLHLFSPAPAAVKIYSFSGTLLKNLGTVNGDAQTTIGKGSYIVVIGQQVFKRIL